jgi:hypothetical protein
MGRHRTDTEEPLSVKRDPEQYWLGQNVLQEMSNTNQNNSYWKDEF